MRFNQHFRRQRVADPRIGPAAVVINRAQAGQGRGVKVFDLAAVVAVQRVVKSLDQQQVAVTIHRQAGSAFSAAVEQAVGVGVFGVQLLDQGLTSCKGSL